MVVELLDTVDEVRDEALCTTVTEHYHCDGIQAEQREPMGIQLSAPVTTIAMVGSPFDPLAAVGPYHSFCY